MKQILLCASALFFGTLAKTQPTTPVPNPFPKTISVAGSAAMEVIPDQIFVDILLSEYQKKGESKKDLETIKTAFLESCRAAGIPDSLISIVSYYGNSNTYFQTHRKKRDPDMMATILYQVRFPNSKMMDDLVERLDDDATRGFSISAVSHSRMTEYRRQLKIRAVQAAREKGIYLTEAIGEKLGEAITITEPTDLELADNNNVQLLQEKTRSNNSVSFYNKYDAVDSGPTIDFKKIRLRFEVNIVFALK